MEHSVDSPPAHGDIVEFTSFGPPSQSLPGIVVGHNHNRHIYYFWRGNGCYGSINLVLKIHRRETGTWVANMIASADQIAITRDYTEAIQLATNTAKAFLREYFPDDPNLVWDV